MAEQQAAVPAGIAFTPFEDRLDVVERGALLAEQLGLSFVSVAEATGLAAPIALAQLAWRTERVGLMTGVLSVWSRTPATLALTAAHLQQLSGGRFVLGLGASTAPIAAGFHGQPWQSPLGRLRDTCVAVRALLRGERLPAAPGGARPLRMSSPPATPVPIAVAGVTEPGIRLAGALADQWLPFLLPAPALEAGRHLISEAATQAGRAARATVTACIPLALGPDHASAARLAASWLVSYTTKMGPVYPRVLREHGYHREIDALLEANPAPELGWGDAFLGCELFDPVS